MRRAFLTLALPLLLAGCAQVFDANLFTGVDVPPKLNADSLKNITVQELKNQMQDQTFIEQLKDDPKALENAQISLGTLLIDPASTAEQVLDTGATLVELTASASGVADMKSGLIQNVSTISDEIKAKHYAAALKLFMGNQTEAEMKLTLDNLNIMAFSLQMMEIKAVKADGTLDSEAFFSKTTDRGSFSVSALMGAIAFALITDQGGGTAGLAADLALATPTVGNNGVQMTAFLAAKDADKSTYTLAQSLTAAASVYCYTYVASIVSELPFPL